MHARRGSRDSKQTCNIAELLPLGLHYQVPWPLSIIVDDTVLQQYNQVLIFLLQVSVCSLSCQLACTACRFWKGRSLGCKLKQHNEDTWS